MFQKFTYFCISPFSNAPRPTSIPSFLIYLQSGLCSYNSTISFDISPPPFVKYGTCIIKNRTKRIPMHHIALPVVLMQLIMYVPNLVGISVMQVWQGQCNSGENSEIYCVFMTSILFQSARHKYYKPVKVRIFVQGFTLYMYNICTCTSSH